MGFFDKLKKKEKIEEKIKEQLPYDIKFSATNDGRLQVDFNELNADFKQFYDTTRLIVGGKTSIVNGQKIESALISWYGISDAIMYDRDGKEFGRRASYEEILLGIDIQRLQNDYNYCVAVMKGLLNKNRVDRYIRDGLQEKPEVECGNYVGEIIQEDGKYKKAFRGEIGQIVHNSSFMKEKRIENERRIEQLKQKNIEEKKAQIDRLNKEIQDLSN